MQEFKENDLVYTCYGYGVIIEAPKKTVVPAEQANGNPVVNAEPVKENENVVADGELKDKAVVEEHPPKAVAREEIVEIAANDSKSTESKNSECMYRLQLRWGGLASIEEKHLKKKIDITIKTFYANKKKISLSVDFNTTIQQLKNILLETHLENPKTICNLRLIYPMGFLQELNSTSQTLEQYKIPDHANIVLLVQTTFTWDPNMKGAQIKLSNNNLTCSKPPDSDYQTALGNISLSSGRHYWEIKVDHYNDDEDLFLGIARKAINLYARPLDTKMFWGYMPLCAKKFGPDGALYDYGFPAKKGDVIGILLEYKSGMATLSFYRNGTKYGVAFSNLAGSFHPAVCMYYGDIQVTLDPKAPMPLS
jgi:tripartite motif-containing protein 9/67